jgi:hypothetical protein
MFATLLLAGSAAAQTAVPITDVAQRANLKVSGGALVYTAGENWSGPCLGAALNYNLHAKLSVFGAYDHGFPLNDLDGEKNFGRVVGSMRVHPSAFVGFGYGWFGPALQGGLAQFLVYKPLMKRLDVAGTYAHVFTKGTQDDFEYFRVFLNYNVLGKD